MKNCKQILALVLALALAFLLTACSGKESKYEGTYVSVEESIVLVLRPDGECVFAVVKWSGIETIDASWKIKNDTLIISADSEDTDLYAWLDDDDPTELWIEERGGGDHYEVLFEKIA